MTVHQRRHKDGLIALVALSYLLLMFHSGSQPTHEHLVHAVSDGVMRPSPQDIVRIEIITQGSRRHYQRRTTSWYDASSNVALNATQASELERAITFMHTATPVRVLSPEEIADLDGDPFGLEHPVLEVELSTISGAVMSARFGHQAHGGILRYMRIEGHAEVYLMSGFVGKAWQRAASFEQPTIRD